MSHEDAVALVANVAVTAADGLEQRPADLCRQAANRLEVER